jgi:hypothetical protein
MTPTTTARTAHHDAETSRTQAQELVDLLEELLSGRPWPLRAYDQIHMRTGHLAAHVRVVASATEGRDLLVMGDSDGLVVGLLCASHLGITAAPRCIRFCDFDRRVLGYVEKTAQRLGLERMLSTHLYNVFDPLTTALVRSADVFHTNPPYGQFNAGRSVIAFVERCLAAIRPGGDGIVISANDPDAPWTYDVHRSIVMSLVERGVTPYRIDDGRHYYWLDDQPNLTSGVIWCQTPPYCAAEYMNSPLPSEFAEHFYGHQTVPIPKYISLDGEPEGLSRPLEIFRPRS